jgi:hypothetical protein
VTRAPGMQSARWRRAPGGGERLEGATRRRVRPLSVLIVALGMLVVPAGLEAQILGVSGAAFNAQRRIYYQSVEHQQTGVLVGGSAALRLGPVQVGAGGWMGTLKGDGSVLNPDVKARTTSARVQVQLVPGVQVGAQYEVRRLEADVSVTVWKLMGANVRLEPGLGAMGLRGLVDVSVLPASSVSGGPKLDMAVQATVGVMLEPRRTPLVFRLAYRFERYDFAASGGSPERYEQFQGIVAEAGLRLGKW